MLDVMKSFIRKKEAELMQARHVTKEFIEDVVIKDKQDSFFSNIQVYLGDVNSKLDLLRELKTVIADYERLESLNGLSNKDTVVAEKRSNA